MRTPTCITVRVLFDQRPGAGIAPPTGSAGRSWRHGRVEQPRAAASNRPRAQPDVLPRHAGAGDLPRVRQRAGPGHGVLSGWRVSGAVGPRRRAASPGHGAVAAGARPGHDATRARRAWRADPAGAEAGAVGAAGDVDRGPRWGAHLHRGGAGGASAAPPRLAEAHAFSSLLRRASDRLETHEQQTHQDRRLAEEIRIAADELVSRLV